MYNMFMASLLQVQTTVEKPGSMETGLKHAGSETGAPTGDSDIHN